MIIDYTAYKGARNKTEISFSAIGCAKTFFVMKTPLHYGLYQESAQRLLIIISSLPLTLYIK